MEGLIRCTLMLICMGLFLRLQAQYIRIQHRWQDQSMKGTCVFMDDSTMATCHMLKYYLRESSGEDATYYIISGDTLLKINNPNSDFFIGVEPSIQEQGVGKGMLDPRHDMYWTWNTGYIQIKFEGECRHASGSTENIMWHIGGFQTENPTSYPIENHMNSKQTLICDLSDWMNLYLPQNPHVMSPSPHASRMAQHFAQAFHWHE